MTKSLRVFVAAGLLLPALLSGQNTTCSLSGTVMDNLGAVIPGAKVTLVASDTGFIRTLKTNGSGFFNYPDLTPAAFNLKVEAAGFRTYNQTGIRISSSEQRSAGDIRLLVGAVTESVTVTAEALTVNLSTGERSGELSGEQLDQIALRGRDIFDAISLMAGVVDTSDGRDAPGPTSIGNIYIMGGRNDQKNMTVDGVTNLDTGSNGSVHSMPSMDSVAEVKVLMSAYSAEFGRNPSSINVITRGGATKYKGSAAWYARNEVFNANDFFTNRAGRPRTPYRFNIASYSISGPLRIPKLIGRRSRAFFFWNQEFQQQVVQYGTRTITVPTALERKGDFSQSFAANGTLINVNDPQANKTLFPNRVIPPSRLTETGKNILNLFPLPNYTDPNPINRYQWNYFTSAAAAYPRRTETARVDWAPHDNWQVYTSLSNNYDHQNTLYGVWVDGSLNFPITPILFDQPGRLATFHSTNSVSPTIFNDASIAISQNTLTYSPLDVSKLDRTKLGIDIAQRNPALNPLNLIPNMTFGGIANAANPSLSNGTPYFNRNTIFSVIDNMTKIAGKQSVKAGVYFEHTRKVQSADAATRGSLSFGQDGNNPLDSNNAYANALLGNYDTYAEATARPRGNFLYTNTEFYLQDTWRVRRNLSLDFGVRFYIDPPQYDANGQLASFSAAHFDPAKAAVLLRPILVNGVKYAQDPISLVNYPQGLVGAFAPGRGDPINGIVQGGKNGTPRGLYTTMPIVAAPRIGFSWDPFNTGRTAIRGGGGIYYDRIQGNPVMGQITNPPSVFSPTQYYGTFADILATAGAGLLAPSGSVSSLATPGHQQAVYNYNLSVQRQITRGGILDIGYAGSLGRHLLWQRNINPVPLGANFLNVNPQNRDPSTTNNVLPANFLRPFQGYGDILIYEFANSSNYNALLVSFQRRMVRSLSFSTSYTFSKALDASDAYSQQIDAFVPAKSRNYGPAGFDRKHVYSANFYWSLPKLGKSSARALRVAANGWELAGVFRLNSGGPFTPGYALLNGINSPTGSASEGARAQVLDPNAPLATRFGPPPEPLGQANVPWTVQSTTPQIGNLGKNTLIGQGTENVDLSLYRTLRFTEKIGGQLRVEGYNALNHTQFAGVDTTLRFDPTGAMYNTLFNTPTSARPARRIQLALRINF